jgi:nucleotide-binding universal stress UspA family protein
VSRPRTKRILAAVAAKQIDLLVTGTIGRTGIPGFFIGNAAETVLQKVDCLVPAIKPDGFRTALKQRAA